MFDNLVVSVVFVASRSVLRVKLSVFDIFALIFNSNWDNLASTQVRTSIGTLSSDS